MSEYIKVYKTKFTDSQKKKFCRGCYADRYNHPGMCERPGIDAVVTSKQCWSLSDSVVVKKGVYFSSHQRTPDIVKTLSCFYPQR